MPTKELYGRYLDEFEVGEVIEHWPARTVTEADDLMFCMLTMNHHPLHTNKQYAEDTQFGQRVVSGPFVYSLVFGMTVPTISGKAIANLATTDLRHTPHPSSTATPCRPKPRSSKSARARASPTEASSPSTPQPPTRTAPRCSHFIEQ